MAAVVTRDIKKARRNVCIKPKTMRLWKRQVNRFDRRACKMALRAGQVDYHSVPRLTGWDIW